jgi:hypothetical protein
VNALAPALNTRSFNSVLFERNSAVVDELPKVATSAAPFGIVLPTQFPAVFQSPVAGLASQVALWAMTGLLESDRSNSAPQRVAVKAERREVVVFIVQVTQWAQG